MSDPLDLHVHRWLPTPRARRTLLLLHGTGGDENDLLPLAQAIAPDASLLSPRGNVLEQGMPRFFRRLAPGVFDLDDLDRRTRDLAAFVEAASREYSFPLESVTAVGFSNGANVAASLLFKTPRVLAGAVLVRAMLPYRPEAPPPVAGKRALVLAGTRDPYSSRESTEELASILRAGGASVDVRFAAAGHELTPEDVSAARSWLATEVAP